MISLPQMKGMKEGPRQETNYMYICQDYCPAIKGIVIQKTFRNNVNAETGFLIYKVVS